MDRNLSGAQLHCGKIISPTGNRNYTYGLSARGVTTTMTELLVLLPVCDETLNAQGKFNYYFAVVTLVPSLAVKLHFIVLICLS
jgi:hypothetical protein